MRNLNASQFDKSAGYNVSTKYIPINSTALVQEFSNAGFMLHSVNAGRVLNSAREGYQKHLFTFRHADVQLKQVGDSLPQILLKNSYDGTSSLHIMLGIYRLVCSNGLIVGKSFTQYNVRHVGANAVQDAVKAALLVSQQAEQAANSIYSMQRTVLTDANIYAFAEQAAALIKPDNVVQYSINSLLAPRRTADNANDLWSVYNRIQENIIRGGFSYMSVNAAGQVRRATRRGVKAIDANIKLNQALWGIAEQFIA